MNIKKLVLYVLSILLVLSSCSSDELNGSGSFKEYFGEWVAQDVSKSESFNLLAALIDEMDENLLLPQPIYSSYIPPLYPTELNNYLQDNKEAVALFEREDCVYVLISTYQATTTKTEYHLDNNSKKKFLLFEMVLSSDMFISKMNASEKSQLMVLALASPNNVGGLPGYGGSGNVGNPFTIMISIMLSSNYPPFVEDIKPMLVELGSGYGLQSTENAITVPGIDSQATDLIRGYAQQFLNDNK